MVVKREAVPASQYFYGILTAKALDVDQEIRQISGGEELKNVN